ncbi:SH3 domain-containing protein [Granulicella arctica]|uniref:SH3 domain-containing protein n=1 Tax=Granulicella arctica TaxID=940613 RepID=UPI0021DFB2B9|nr:SH3 domain-containing protein [Granulicella arctica]
MQCFLRTSLAGSLAVTMAFVAPAVGQRSKQDKTAGYDRAARATVLHEANVYISPDADAQKISLVTPGHEVVVIERNGPWIRVFANTDVEEKADDADKTDFGEEDNVTPASGWIRDKGVVGPTTKGGDAILYGAAATLEEQASEPHAPKGAAGQAHLLYRRVADYFPDSSIAPEAAWRSADVRWQLEKRDVSTLPSAKEQEAFLRPAIYDGEMKKVIKTYPGTKFAAMAAFKLIDNKLCGDWQGLPKCPEMESGLYEKYAQQFPDGPMTAEALYDAVYRQGVLVTMYTVEENKKRADNAAAHTQALAEQLRAKYPASDYSARGASLAYRVAQGISVYGNDRD